nr:MAG TPA: hypothetical protein [Microviridae sp.]
MNRIYEFSFIPKHLAYMVKDITEKYWYLYIRNKEVGIVTETEWGFYIYDYSKLENIYAGSSILTLSIQIRRVYRLFSNVPRETTN